MQIGPKTDHDIVQLVKTDFKLKIRLITLFQYNLLPCNRFCMKNTIFSLDNDSCANKQTPASFVLNNAYNFKQTATFSFFFSINLQPFSQFSLMKIKLKCSQNSLWIKEFNTAISPFTLLLLEVITANSELRASLIRYYPVSNVSSQNTCY